MTTPAVRLALCGAGRWGKRFLETIKAESANPGSNLCLKAVVSRNSETQNLVPTGCKVLPTWQALMQRDDIDGVIIATPPATHFEIARACIEKRLPCLIEKPLTTSLTEALELQKLAIERNSLVMVDHTLLFHPAYTALKKSLGVQKITAIDSVGCNWGPFRPDYNALYDYGPHDVAFCLDLLKVEPDYIEVTRDVPALPELKTSANAGRYHVGLTFSTGAAATIMVSNIEENKQRWLKIRTTEQVLTFDDLAKDQLRSRRGGNETILEFEKAMPLTQALRSFIKLIRHETSLEVSQSGLDLGVKVIRTLDRISAKLAE